MSDPGSNTERSSVAAATAPPRRSGSWLRLFLYLVIFVSGGLVGAGGGLLIIRSGALFAVHHPEAMPARIVDRIDSSLSLSDPQRRQVESILRERQRAIQEIRVEFQPRVEEELDRLEADVSAVLDPVQREKWQRRIDYLRRTWLPPLPPGK
ncbi:MAG: hypothetical protein ACYC6Y_15910 [Thermoguttaceae bacterium]